MSRLILDLCGGTGAWSRPYAEAGYRVELIDLPLDVRLFKPPSVRCQGILAAPPCTCFSYARNRYPPTDDELRAALSVVDACIRVVMACNPVWWALENPRNKLRRYLGQPRMAFYQYEYGDGQMKPTCVWGNFNLPQKSRGRRTKPSTYKTERQNADPEDAITPPGFARAFFKANP
jgi:hypothetical protein